MSSMLVTFFILILFFMFPTFFIVTFFHNLNPILFHFFIAFRFLFPRNHISLSVCLRLPPHVLYIDLAKTSPCSAGSSFLSSADPSYSFKEAVIFINLIFCCYALTFVAVNCVTDLEN